jgi:hypothetical protein
MRFQTYILAAISALFLFSCKKDFLQRDPGVPIDYAKLFSDPKQAAGFGDNSYNFLINDYARFVGAHQGTTSEFTDEAVSNTGLAPVSVMNNGQFLSPNAFDVINPYTMMYRGIRNANVMLANIEKVPWTSVYNPEYIRGEQLFLRAFFYFELMKRYGGVALLDKAQTVEESGLDLPRASFDETLTFIIKDLDAAARLLPTDWPVNYYGRATVGAAMALKARALLYAASPLNNTGNDNSKWKTAAAASKAVLDLNKYSLEPNYSNVLFANNSPEYIMISIKAARDFNATYINDFIVPPSMGGAQSLISPTQNHVDLYEMSNGKPITDPSSGYNPQQPYVNRDPRFYNNIIYNDQTWIGRKVETFTGGKDVSATTNIYTKTGYYLKRLWPEVLRKAGDKAVVNYIYFRYAEVLMNYAEALNEAEGPTPEVFKAVNAVRGRAGMPALPATLTKDQMTQRIRNERAVEFAFEDMRWWDILRWKQGAVIITQPMTGMRITKSGINFSYSVFTLATNYQKSFQDYMHLYPIPQAEIFKSAGALKQNPNW